MSPEGPRPAADMADGSWIRRFQIRARLAALGVLSALVVVGFAAVAWTSLSVAGERGSRLADLSLAQSLNTQASDRLAGLADRVLSPPGLSRAQLDEEVAAQTRLALRIGDLLAREGLEEERARTVAADGRALQAVRSLARAVDSGDSAGLAAAQDEERTTRTEALRARAGLDEALARRIDEARRSLEAATSVGRWAIPLAAVAAAVSLVSLARAIARSVVGPLRTLGRVMRRFGDGDRQARAPVAPDEVGTAARSFNHMADAVAGRLQELSDDAERGVQLRIIADALDVALDESDVHRIVEHALSILAPGRPAELLVNDVDATRLRRVAANLSGGPPGCPVGETTSCPAIRRARTLVFDRSDSINACPFLRDRPSGPLSAVCVPLSTGGTLAGVLHAAGPYGVAPPTALVEQLVTLTSQAGNRIGAMRTLASSRAEAATDGLTGVANRRTLEATLADLLRTSTPFVLVVADLDHFKAVNDTYGHEVGDRALQLFAQVLASNVRGRDLVARYGGEEFVLVYPEMNVAQSMEVLDRIRTALDAALERTDLPRFTCSYGVTHSSVGGDVEEIIRVADAGLLMAKDLGRDRVVYADADLAAEVFSRRADRRD